MEAWRPIMDVLMFEVLTSLLEENRIMTQKILIVMSAIFNFRECLLAVLLTIKALLSGFVGSA